MREGPSQLVLIASSKEVAQQLRIRDSHATHETLGAWRSIIFVRVPPKDADWIRSGKQATYVNPGAEPGALESNRLAT